MKQSSKQTITAHMVVKNDDLWVRAAIESVLPYVDSFLVTDTGSSDQTILQIQSIQSQKIHLTCLNTIDLVMTRQQQLEQTHTDWIWMIDGDEIYPPEVCEEITNHLNPELSAIVVKRYDCLGDVYHYQPDESVAAYTLAGVTGHYNLRLINRHLPGLHLEGIYPNEGFYDKDGRALVNYPAKAFYVTKNRYIHTTYLKRSSKGNNLIDTLHRKKYKIEWGKPLPKQIIAAIAHLNAPKRDLIYQLAALLVTPIKMMKRKILS